MTATAPATDLWLTCRVDKGMFSDEMAVTYPASGEVLVSVFVPVDTVTVRGQLGGLGKVRVNIFRRGDTTFAVLPTEYSESVAITEADLSDAP